jgi:hypothetical protein
VDGDGDTASDDAKAQGHAKLSERLKKMSEWGGVGQMRVRARTMEHAIEVAGDVGCGYGFAVVGVGIEGGSLDDVRRGIGEGGVDLNGKVWGGWLSSIDYAIKCRDDDGVVSALIECGADVNGTTVGVGGGGTYLHHAAAQGRSGVCSALIAAGVDVNGVNENGNTALHFAASRGQHGVCEVLVGRGANVGAVDKDNNTAAAVARSAGHEGVAAYLDGLIGRGTSGR